LQVGCEGLWFFSNQWPAGKPPITDFSGGTATMFWSDTVNLFGAPVDAGDDREIIAAIGLASSNSNTALPPSSITRECDVEITVPFSPGTTITVGTVASPALFQGVGDNTPTVAATYLKPQRTPSGSTGLSVVRTTIAGGPVAGAGFTMVRYTMPNN
jgi:hypothetical protein